ncbi:hypothetical protein Gogos_021844 [Gossypium gossypioides]|uniref:Uncharacterized protein n=1 Tax=Gossypium gossypioides TaxID=34282 RepID=A0A7J9D2H1_GOSGO|nr:hypothetical protein [Gossypium gossypioides]
MTINRISLIFIHQMHGLLGG